MIGEESPQYIVVCEDRMLFKLESLKLALFFTVAAYYCFNLEYPTQAKSVFHFIQDYILGQPDSSKKSATYIAVVSDIHRNLFI